MMSRAERQFVKWLAAFFYGVAIFLGIGLVMWFAPRSVVKSATLMTTDKLEYKVGERIIVSGETWTNIDAPATFDARLICGGVKYDYAHISNFNISKNASPTKYVYPYPPIPEFIPKGKCQIVTTSNYEVQILPLLTRNYQHKFTSNEFEVI